MAKLFPETKLTIDGREYRLVLDINAQVLAEDAASTPDKEVAFVELAKAALRGRITATRLLFWASLQRYQPEITLAQAGQLMSEANAAATAALMDAAKEAEPDPADMDALEVRRANPQTAQPPSDGTGGRSRSRLAVAG